MYVGEKRGGWAKNKRVQLSDSLVDEVVPESGGTGPKITTSNFKTRLCSVLPHGSRLSRLCDW